MSVYLIGFRIYFFVCFLSISLTLLIVSRKKLFYCFIAVTFTGKLNTGRSSLRLGLSMDILGIISYIRL